MAVRTTGRRWTLAACVVLVGVAVVAVAFQGVPEFSGPRVFLPQGPVRTGAPDQGMTGTPQPHETTHPLRLDLTWLLVALIILAVIVVLAILWRRRRRPQAPPTLPELADLSDSELSDAPREEEPEPEPEQVRRGLDRAAEELAARREPRDAIERAWVGLEEGAADSGVRRLPAETPAEFAARVVARVDADREAAAGLLSVYQRARFGSGPVTVEDVDTARAAVEALRASWGRHPAAGRGTAS
ncbi:DUF4129 domain-containing protein [Leifsonia virtsii]|uniref:DUF4129 domain-containing protein n=1 Tax=Leifsonia virtsii TaxID=3035915 RepID=A0ABT8ITC4_9MICO|nr:DUF4129 domain-containing protein [Leifsonia virtsii]MDN4596052.1 DUF4129 domain-containing protein [Leifsonia virtsii]